MTGQTNQDASLGHRSSARWASARSGAAGYNVLTWDARGFGGSGGQVEADSQGLRGPRRAGADRLTSPSSPRPSSTRRNDPRLGMSGPSYGGGIQLVTRGHRPARGRHHAHDRVELAAHRPLQGGLGEAGLGHGLLGVRGPDRRDRRAGQPGGPPDRRTWTRQINQALVEGAATGRFSDKTVAFFRARGTGPLVERIRVPTLLLQGTADTLFTLKEAMRNHAILKRNGVPVKMIWFCGGHGVCLGGRRARHGARAGGGELVRPLPQAQGP